MSDMKFALALLLCQSLEQGRPQQYPSLAATLTARELCAERQLTFSAVSTHTPSENGWNVTEKKGHSSQEQTLPPAERWLGLCLLCLTLD